MEQRVPVPRVATVADATVLARLLEAFNREYDDPTPGVEVLATRLTRLLVGRDVLALLAGDPPVGVALVTLRPNVWYDGPVALLDELYVRPELRGRGTGTALIGRACDVVRERAAPRGGGGRRGGRGGRPPLRGQRRRGRRRGAAVLRAPRLHEHAGGA